MGELISIKHIKEFDNYLSKDSFSTRDLSGKPLTGKDKYSKIYHTTSLNSFSRIWEKKRLKFSPVAGVNDVVERFRSISLANPRLLPMLFAMEDIMNAYKQISFTMDFNSTIKGYASPLIWGIYGDKGNGVCIELDYDKLNLPENCFHDIVTYENNVNKNIELTNDIVSVKSLKSYIERNKNELFFLKDMCWCNENEYRIISDTHEYLDISNAITAVYIATLNESTFEKVDELLKDTNIKFGYVHFDKKSGTLFPSDAREYKESINSAANNPNNFLLNIYRQAKEHYESLKNNPEADLTKIEYQL